MRSLSNTLGLGVVVFCAAATGCSEEQNTPATPPVAVPAQVMPTDMGAVVGPAVGGDGPAATAGGAGSAVVTPTMDAPHPGAQGATTPADATAGAVPPPLGDVDAGAAPPPADFGLADSGTPAPAASDDASGDLAPIAPPVADDCIRDVSAGDHSFTCQGITFLTMVDPQCTERACGLIVDVHGATMSGEVMRMNNRLHELAPPQGYIAVQPTAPSGAWDFERDPPAIADFMERMIGAFHLNTRRIHVTGFSMGSGVTFWFLCNRPDLIASAGPVTGSSADQVRAQDTGMSCIEALDDTWQPRVPILFMSGTADSALSIAAARRRTDGIVARLGLSGGDQIDGDGQFRRMRWTGEGGMVFDFLEHDYAGLVAGHCIPGPTPDAVYGCTSGNVTLDWGQTILQWFIEHPKP